MKNPLISICIPAFNRPKELLRLLKSIDTIYPEDLEIVICEDNSPKREEIRNIVNKFILDSSFKIYYYENPKNFGYDRNLRELISKSNGIFILFMGDDDLFIPKSLDKLIKFLYTNKSLGYVLKSHRYIYKDGKIELFRYYKGDKFFEPGVNTYIELFRKSVFISGFIINRNYIEDNYLIDEFDGTLLYQLYLMAEITLKHKSAYFDCLLVEAREEGVPYFGMSEVEKPLYTPGIITIENSINFLKSFFKITSFIDNKYKIKSTPTITKDMSKYFYPSLAIQRNKGIKEFIRYFKELNKLGFNCTIYYYIYFIGLLLFGKNFCDSIIVNLKQYLKHTPRL